jgi:hypothetical protein
VRFINFVVGEANAHIRQSDRSVSAEMD